MTRVDFADLVEYVESRWGRIESWINAATVASDFDDLDSETVWDSLLRWFDNPEHKWPPAPPRLRAVALDRMRAQMRHESRPELPESVETYDWATYAQETYGEVISLPSAYARRHDELVAQGRIVCEHPHCLDEDGNHRLPDE